jgi:4-carboxymuconolactone decarboxylase
MDDQKRREVGMAQRRKVLGNAWVDKSVANTNSFNAEFIDLITRHAWADNWTRPHFDERTRRVLVMGSLLALCQWDEFRLQVRAALTEGGFTPDDIKEIVLQQAIYCACPPPILPSGKPRRYSWSWAAQGIDRLRSRCDLSAQFRRVRN